jgi:hypothetical protein
MREKGGGGREKGSDTSVTNEPQHNYRVPRGTPSQQCYRGRAPGGGTRPVLFTIYMEM